MTKTLVLAHFWSIFTILGAKNFSEKSGSVTHNFIWVPSAPCQNLEKTNDTIPRKCPDRWKDGRMEGWTDPTS